MFDLNLSETEVKTVMAQLTAAETVIRKLCEVVSPSQQYLLLTSLSLNLDIDIDNLRREHPEFVPLTAGRE